MPVPGYEGRYEVSNLGRVRNKTRVLVGKLNKKGYRRYNLVKDGRTRTTLGHRIVCEAFHGAQPAHQPLATHRNGIRDDNRASNLRWADNAQNMRDKRTHGTDHEVNKTHCPAGHAYAGENLIFEGTTRRCRACRNRRARVAWHARHGRSLVEEKED